MTFKQIIAACICTLGVNSLLFGKTLAENPNQIIAQQQPTIYMFIARFSSGRPPVPVLVINYKVYTLNPNGGITQTAITYDYALEQGIFVDFKGCVNPNSSEIYACSPPQPLLPMTQQEIDNLRRLFR